MLDSLGVDTPADLRFIYAEDLVEDGITYAEALISSPAVVRALPVRVHGRYGAIRSRPLQGRRPEPIQREPISSITLNWPNPPPLHEMFRQQNTPSASVGTILGAPKLQSVCLLGKRKSTRKFVSEMSKSTTSGPQVQREINLLK